MALNIKQAIKRKGMTSKQVAEILGMTSVNLSYHINGNPSVEILQRIADAIGCDIAELFDAPPVQGHDAVCPKCGEIIKICLH